MDATCPSCGRKGRTAKTTGLVRCSECGKEFKPGAGSGAGRTIVLAILAFIVTGGLLYFAMGRADKLDAEEKEKAAAAERLQKGK
jgi:uncharacterized protein (DUF983 family)